MSTIVAHNKLRDGSLKNTTQAQTPESRPSKTQCRSGGGTFELWKVQSTQLGFSRPLLVGCATSNGANKSAMPRAEWAITKRQAVLYLVKMKYQYFVLECCKQNTIFSAIIRGHIMIIYQQTSDMLSVSSMGTAAAWWLRKFQDNFANKEGTDSEDSEYPFSTLCQRQLQCIALVMQKLQPALQKHLCQIGNFILPESEKLKLDHFNPFLLKYFTRVEVSESYVRYS